ncbi:MAG: type I 3-dehydroquinate dehydratase [Treponema sp.]|nr:type I 3-dehydroquinate dehydratase [Treponema sp.]
MAKICLCLTAETLTRNLEILEQYRKYADVAELRVDCLEPNERLLIRRFPEKANMPIILSIRRDTDGGQFGSGEGARVSLMAKGLAYADTDRRRNFAYIDLEKDLNVPSLEEAARTFGTKIIRSHHNFLGTDADLADKIRSTRRSDNEIVKVSVTANSTADVLALLRAGRECPGQEKILIAMGHYGLCSRILAEQFGSSMSYTSALSEPNAPAGAPGQFDTRELAARYRFRSITGKTKIFGVVGYPLKYTASPNFFNTIFELEDIDAICVPLPADSIGACMELARELKIEGLSVTVPYKEAIIPFLGSQSAEVQRIGACNTLSLCPQGWMGTNTDAKGFSDSLLAFAGRTNLKRQRVTVIGAGGIARAVLFELNRLGAKALVLNRTIHKARNLAVPYDFAWGGLDSQGIAMMGKFRDIIIQATPVGMEEDDTGDPSHPLDPAPMYSFSGREEVMDLVYKPEMTAFLQRAADTGCRVQNGYDMLIRQARYQYAQFMGKDFPERLLARVRYGA